MTICSYDNSGQLKFDVDIEMEQGYWNTSSSRLWTRIRDLMHDDIVATYNNMRQNGVSYENMMHYIYDEQIAKIPQTYYNKDYDIKYAPFADSYIGMAHGDTYEHVKRWLKQRFTFVDTLFDYAPSYNNDVLTIRANTTELMTLEIETYTPVYQHLSWYNGQMDKKKIDGKVSVEFSGTAQAATDQEVLIYGGSNIKSIKGITSMNPNRMLIGSATKLVEIDAHDCPLLADINANKANLSPHEYLNKVNLSNCPLLEGNLRLNNSPLVQEINIKGTNITGMNLPSSIRNLEVLRLPNTITELTLNDAGMLHTLDFDKGVNLQSVSMTNCNALENVTGLDLLQTPSIILNNSYNNVAELYFKDTTNLFLSNMSNLERVIFTPNNEYETFELINVANAPDYKVTTFNCPKLSTFMTTAPYRESYNNCGMTTISETTGILVYKDFSPNGTKFSKVVPFDYYNDVIEAEIDLTNCDINHTNENILSFAINEDALVTWGNTPAVHIYYTPSSKTLKFNYYANSYNIEKIITDTIVNIKMDKGTIYLNNEIILEGSIIEDKFSPNTTITIGSAEGLVRSTALYKLVGVNYSEFDKEVKEYGDIQPNTTFTANSIDISNTQFTDVKLLCTTDTNVLKLPTTVKNFYCDSSFDLDTDYLEDGEYDVVHGELVEPYTTDYEGEVVLSDYIIEYMRQNGEVTSNMQDGYRVDSSLTIVAAGDCATTQILPVPANKKLTIKSSGTGLRIRIGYYNTDKNMFAQTSSTPITTPYEISFDDNTSYFVITYYKDAGMPTDAWLEFETTYTPNLIPSSADGSLIFSMYAPSNTVAPASGTWDLHGLEFDNFHTFGMNNDVKPSEDSYVKVADVSNMKVFTGGSSRSLQYGNIYYDTGQKDTRCITNIKLPAGRYVIKRSDGGAPTVYTSTTPDGTQSIVYNMNNGQTFDTDIYITMGLNKDYFPITINDVQYRIEDMELVDTLSILQEIQGSNGTNLSGNIMASDYGSTIYTHGDNIFEELDEIKSITMPARYDDYNITIKNADISPKTHNTMLYPLLVNEDNPITGTLDYTNYTGKHLSWSFAYTDEDYVNIIQPKDELLNSYEYRYNAFYDTEYEFDNPYEIARYTSSTSGVLPNFNKEFTYTYDEIDNGNGTYTTKVYTDSLDNLPTRISFATKSVISVDKLNTSQATNLNGLFQNCNKLEYVNTENWDTSNVTNMTNMFHSCSSLTSLNLSGFDTSKVNTMASMFYGCSNLTSLDLSGFDTSNVTNMSYMFYGCSNLTSLNLSGFDTSKVNTMASMFSGCSNLTSLDLSGFDTSKVTSMASMFYSCSGLTSLDVSGFDTKNVTSISDMFNGCQKLTEITGLENWDTSQITQMGNTFNQCFELKSLQGIENWNVEKVISLYFAFRYCKKITSLDLSNWNITSALDNIGYAFMLCESLEYLDLSNWDVSNVTSYAACFSFGTPNKIERINLNGWVKDKIELVISTLPTKTETSTVQGTVIIDESTLPSGWIYDNVMVIAKYTANATGVLPGFNTEFTGYTTGETDNGDGTYTVSIATDSLDNLPTKINFTANTNLLTVDKLNTSKVTTMYQMFRSCENLTRINCRLDTSRVTNEISLMFIGCTKLEYVDVTNLVGSNIKYAASLFSGCTLLSQIDGLNTWDTSNVTGFTSMFYGCSSLTSLDLSGFDTSNVTNMSTMFQNCSGLTSLDLSNFDTGKVTTIYQMFAGCTALTELVGLSDWDTSALTDISYAFQSLALDNLDLGGWDLTNCTAARDAWNFMYSLDSIVFPNNLSVSFGIGQSYNLTADNVVEIFNKLATVTTTQTANIGVNLLNKLSEDQIAIATNKGWTVA